MASGISDHLPIFLFTGKKIAKYETMKQAPHYFQDVSELSDIEMANWDMVYSANTTDEAYNRFLKQFVSIYKKCFKHKAPPTMRT